MLNRSLVIRDFRSNDLDTMYEIDRTCFPSGMAFSREKFQTCFSRTDTMGRIAEVSGEIAGFVVVEIEDSRQAYVITLDVIPEARRCGIGFNLMTDIHRIIRKKNVSVSNLEVAVINIPARSLYEKLQYRYAGFLPGYYKNQRGYAGGSGRYPEEEYSGQHVDRNVYNGNCDAFRMIRIF